MRRSLLTLMLLGALGWDTAAQAETQTLPDPVPDSARHELLWWEGRVKVQGMERTSMIPPMNLGQEATLVLGDDGQAWILRDDQGLIHVQGPGNWRQDGDVRGKPPRSTLHPIQPEPGVRHEHLWSTNRSGPPWRPDFRGEEAELLRPVNTAVTSSEPSLSWAVPTAKGELQLTLWRVEPTGRWEVLESWKGVQGPMFRPWTSLQPGDFYIWRVRREDPVTGTVVERNAQFATLSREASASLLILLRATEKVGANPGSRGALQAALYSSWGLREESIASWRALAASHPGRPEIKSAIQQAMRIRVDHPDHDGTPPWPFDMQRSRPTLRVETNP